MLVIIIALLAVTPGLSHAAVGQRRAPSTPGRTPTRSGGAVTALPATLGIVKTIQNFVSNITHNVLNQLKNVLPKSVRQTVSTVLGKLANAPKKLCSSAGLGKSCEGPVGKLVNIIVRLLALPFEVAHWITHFANGVISGVNGFLTAIARGIGGLARGLHQWFTGIINFLDRAFGIQPGGTV